MASAKSEISCSALCSLHHTWNAGLAFCHSERLEMDWRGFKAEPWDAPRAGEGLDLFSLEKRLRRPHLCVPVFDVCLQRSQTLLIYKEPCTKNGEMGTRGTGGDSSWSQEDNFVTMVTCRRYNNSPGTWWKLILENVRFGYTKCWMLCYGMCFYHNRLDQLTSEVLSNLSFDFSYL